MAVQYVPIDVNSLHKSLRRFGVTSVSLQFLEDYLIREGIMVTKCDDRVNGGQPVLGRGGKESRRGRQLTLSEMLGRTRR